MVDLCNVLHLYFECATLSVEHVDHFVFWVVVCFPREILVCTVVDMVLSIFCRSLCWNIEDHVIVILHFLMEEAIKYLLVVDEAADRERAKHTWQWHSFEFKSKMIGDIKSANFFLQIKDHQIHVAIIIISKSKFISFMILHNVLSFNVFTLKFNSSNQFHIMNSIYLYYVKVFIFYQ